MKQQLWLFELFLVASLTAQFVVFPAVKFAPLVCRMLQLFWNCTSLAKSLAAAFQVSSNFHHFMQNNFLNKTNSLCFWECFACHRCSSSSLSCIFNSYELFQALPVSNWKLSLVTQFKCCTIKWIAFSQFGKNSPLEMTTVTVLPLWKWNEQKSHHSSSQILIENCSVCCLPMGKMAQKFAFTVVHAVSAFGHAKHDMFASLQCGTNVEHICCKVYCFDGFWLSWMNRNWTAG